MDKPELAYLNDLRNNPNVNWQKVNEAYKTWDYQAQGLTQEAAIIIAIVITIVTFGAGAAIGGAVAGTAGVTSTAVVGTATAATATTFAAAGSTVLVGTTAAMANAAFSSLISQAAISMINNQGDIGAVMKDMGSDEYLKSLAISVATAGAGEYADQFTGSWSNSLASSTGMSQGIANSVVRVGTKTLISSTAQSAIYGDNFAETFLDRLQTSVIYEGVDYGSSWIGEQYHFNEINKFTQLTLHGALGCAAGAAISGNCGAGAAGQVVGELAGELYVKNGGYDLRTGGNIGLLAGAITVAATGGDARDIYMGANLGQGAAQNNALFLIAPLAVEEATAAVAAAARACAINPTCAAIARQIAIKTGQEITKVLIQIGDWANQSGVDTSSETFYNDFAKENVNVSKTGGSQTQVSNSGNSASTPPDGDWEPEEKDIKPKDYQITQQQKELDTYGPNSLRRSYRSLEKQIFKHQEKIIENPDSIHVNHWQKEIRNFRQTQEAIKTVLTKNGVQL